MWEPTPEQQSRIKKTLAAMVEAAEKHWEWVEIRNTSDEQIDKEPSRRAKFEAIVTALKNRWPGEEWAERAAEVYVFPLERGIKSYRGEKEFLQAYGLYRLSRLICLRTPSRRGVELLCDRFRYILSHPFAGREQSDYSSLDNYQEPGLEGCLKQIIAASELALPFLEELAAGRYDAKVEIPQEHQRNYKCTTTYQLHQQYLRPIYDAWQALERAGRFDYERYKVSCRLFPDAMPRTVWGLGHDDGDEEEEVSHVPSPPDDPAEARIEQYAKDFAWEMASRADERELDLLHRYYALAGARFLLRACELIEADPKIKRINKSKSYQEKQKWQDVLGLMARLASLDPSDEPDKIVAALKKFSVGTLKIVQAVGGAARKLVNRALAEKTGTKDLGPVQELVRTINRTFCGDCSWVEANSADTTKGVLDQITTRAVLAEYSAEEVREALTLVLKSDREVRPAVTVIQALMGWNEADIEKGFAKRNQIAVRAYGLLPLPEGEKGKKACLERYLALHKFAKESNTFGQQRRANERGAVGAGLANLANTAGYGDPTRLEWAMEARLSQEGRAARKVTVNKVAATLEIDEDGPQITYVKAGKPQKTMPAELKEHPQFLELKELQKALKSQQTRCRAALERLCAEATPLAPEDLKGLASLPSGRPLAERLLFKTQDGQIGLYDPDAHALSKVEDAGGKPSVRLDAPVTVVHPLDLFESGLLARWQQSIISRQVVQPFKQAFRELYLLTPAEKETRLFSNRFAGHVLNTRPLSGLISNRGWQTTDEADICKLFPQSGLKAFFLLADVGHYLTESETVTSDRVEFRPHVRSNDSSREDDRVPLEKIPPRLLSEVLRDVDLFVSVAQVAEGDEGHFSKETYVKRGELLTTILESMGLPNVTVEGHFARVKGSLSNYRVHLGSAAIHLEPGNYLCVVPARSARRTDLFLPFADAEDPKLSEVVSKIVLLANDKKIKDQSILSQIKNAGS